MSNEQVVPDVVRVNRNNRKREPPKPLQFLVYDDANGKKFKEGRFGQAIKNLGNGDQGATVSLHREELFGFVVFKRLGLANNARNEKRHAQMADPEDQRNMTKTTDREVLLTPELTRHPHIVDFYGYVEKEHMDKTVGLLIEYMPGGSLKDLIDHNKEVLTDAFIKRTLLHIARALAYCHKEHNLVHRNVKPSNILFSRDLKTAKLADFCFARKAETHQMSAKAGGSLRYIAPEVQNDIHGPLAAYGQKADVYSFALVAYAITHSQEPFSNEEISNQHRFYQALTNTVNPLRPKIDPKIDGEINLLITQNWINEEVTHEGETVNGRWDMTDIVRYLDDMVMESP